MTCHLWTKLCANLPIAPGWISIDLNAKDSWKTRNQPLLWSFTVEEESYPSGRKEMQLDTVFAWLDHGNQVTAKVSSLISSEEWIPHCKIPLIPIPAVSSLCNIKVWHIQRRLTLPHHLPVSPPPASTPHCQTNRTRTFSDNPIYCVSMAMGISTALRLCCYCNVAASVRAYRCLWRQRREEPFCQEDNCWSPWNIKFRLRFAENVAHWSHSCVPWRALCLRFMWF